MESCIFCKIVNKKLDAKIVFEDDTCIAFEDISPQAPVHILLIPKKHIESIDRIEKEDLKIVTHLIGKISEIARKRGIKSYRVVSNVGEESGQSVFHLHFHILGGRRMNWPPG